MTSSSDAGLRRVRAVLRVGARLAGADTALGAEARRRLVDLAVLSPAGVELALEHLETSATDAELEALVANVETAPRVHVLLSANVCTAALRAIALALAASSKVCLRASRRDPILAELLVEALREDPELAADGVSVELVERLSPSPGDAAHLYGSDEALEAAAESFPRGVSVFAHGTGYGVAVMDPGALGSSVEALARDVIVFDQSGCLSPRVVFVDGDAMRAEALASELHRVLTGLGRVVPRGALDPETEAAIARYASTIQTLGSTWVGSDHVVGVDATPRALLLPPPARVVHLMPTSAERVAGLLSAHHRFITVVGISGESTLAQAVCACAPYARRVAVGQMQRPPLDGPVDRRPRLDD